jgi:hypothetical protein
MGTCILDRMIALIKNHLVGVTMSEYTVIQPSQAFKNKTYQGWVQDWSNWFYQANPDRNNNGEVVFLRSMPLSDGNYTGEGVVMVGNDSLEISEDQGVLVPVITANYVADHSETAEWLYGTVRSHILGGDHPPSKEQLRINGEPFDDGSGEEYLGKYEIETPIFTLNIPDSSLGPSLKDQIEVPMQSPGFFPSVTRGYFVILRLSAGEHDIECYATGATTAYGQYYASLLYHISVQESREREQVNVPPSRLGKNIIANLQDKHTKGEIDKNEFERLKTLLLRSRQSLVKGMSQPKTKEKSR